MQARREGGDHDHVNLAGHDLPDSHGKSIDHDHTVTSGRAPRPAQRTGPSVTARHQAHGPRPGRAWSGARYVAGLVEFGGERLGGSHSPRISYQFRQAPRVHLG